MPRRPLSRMGGGLEVWSQAKQKAQVSKSLEQNQFKSTNIRIAIAEPSCSGSWIFAFAFLFGYCLGLLLF